MCRAKRTLYFVSYTEKSILKSFLDLLDNIIVLF